VVHEHLTDQAIHLLLSEPAWGRVHGCASDLAAHREAVVRGSGDEDFGVTRCFQHFYDPMSRGKLEVNFKELLSTEDPGKVDAGVRRFLEGLAFELPVRSNAVEWAYDHPLNDFSWLRAVDAKRNNETALAYESLGHVCHLLQDMAAPPPRPQRHPRHPGRPRGR
jgi:hypothetical protein